MKAIVYVAALTYKRQEGISRLLAGLAALDPAGHAEVRFLIVDNDPEGSARSAVEACRSWFGAPLLYAVEAEPGIPAARNRALWEAAAGGARVLCFLDDDETPDSDWLNQLLRRWRESGAVLVGGPLLRTMPSTPMAMLRRLFGLSLIARRRLGEARKNFAFLRGKRVPVYTSNWLCDLDAIQSFGLRFDEAMRFSGGSDEELYRQVVALGMPTSWAAKAIVREPISPERCTVAYQFHRSRAQGMVLGKLKRESITRTIILQLPRACAGIILTIVPILGPASFATGIHLLGSAAGHVAFHLGDQSQLYARADEAKA